MAAAVFLKKIDMVVVGVIFFSLFLDIDGQPTAEGSCHQLMAIFLPDILTQANFIVYQIFAYITRLGQSVGHEF